MTNLSLPDISILNTKKYNFSDFQNEIVYSTFSEIMEKNKDLNDDIQDLIVNIINYYVDKFTRNNVNKIVIYYYTDDIHVRVHTIQSVGILVELLCNFININISQYGLFTDYWETFNSYAMMYFINDDEANIDEILDYSFEQSRKETIEKTYTHNNHDIIYTPEMVERTNENKDCKLCFDESTHQCSKCKYSLCNTCIDKLKHSNGKCPCCQAYPLELDLIKS